LFTAAGLILASASFMLVRYTVLGNEIRLPAGPENWMVTLLVQGESEGEARLLTATPLDFGRQHIVSETCKSEELHFKLPDARHPEHRNVIWTPRGGKGPGPFRARYEFRCSLDVHRPSVAMSRQARVVYAAPAAGEYLDVAACSGSDGLLLSNRAAQFCEGKERPLDQVQTLFRFVDQEIANEPYVEGIKTSSADCLRQNGGDAGAKSRLLVALLRYRGIPARLVAGLTLGRGQREQRPHYWVEAWVGDRWIGLCPFHHHFERVPASYLVLGFGDTPIVRGRNVRNLHYAFLVESRSAEELAAGKESSWLHTALVCLSFSRLPGPEARLVEFLLLLPVAALLVCLFRNVVGLASFGTFAPALVGLAFRDLHSLPGMLVFVAIILIGWVMRRILDAFHLLQVPRTAVLLSLVVILLITAIVAANARHLPATQYVALFPMVILTGMVERFWTLESEESVGASFKTLLGTLIISASIALVLSLHAVVTHLFRYPETLGLVMAGQLLLGRYTGYRLSELLRFRDFLSQQPDPVSIPSNL
jgi:hypothetical protein